MEPADFNLRDEDRLAAVTNYRRDPLSRLEDAVEDLGTRLHQLLARVRSHDRVVAAEILLERLLFVFDIFSDLLVVYTLWGKLPLVAYTSIGILLLPYAVISVALGPRRAAPTCSRLPAEDAN